jgi:hypothetical protein
VKTLRRRGRSPGRTRTSDLRASGRRRLGECAAVVKRRRRLSSTDLSTGRSHCRIADIRVDHPDCALNHIPAVATTTRSTESLVKLAGQAEDYLGRLRSRQQGLLRRRSGQS